MIIGGVRITLAILALALIDNINGQMSDLDIEGDPKLSDVENAVEGGPAAGEVLNFGDDADYTIERRPSRDGDFNTNYKPPQNNDYNDGYRSGNGDSYDGGWRSDPLVPGGENGTDGGTVVDPFPPRNREPVDNRDHALITAAIVLAGCIVGVLMTAGIYLLILRHKREPTPSIDDKPVENVPMDSTNVSLAVSSDSSTGPTADGNTPPGTSSETGSANSAQIEQKEEVTKL